MILGCGQSLPHTSGGCPSFHYWEEFLVQVKVLCSERSFRIAEGGGGVPPQTRNPKMGLEEKSNSGNQNPFFWFHANLEGSKSLSVCLLGPATLFPLGYTEKTFCRFCFMRRPQKRNDASLKSNAKAATRTPRVFLARLHLGEGFGLVLGDLPQTSRRSPRSVPSVFLFLRLGNLCRTHGKPLYAHKREWITD